MKTCVKWSRNMNTVHVLYWVWWNRWVDFSENNRSIFRLCTESCMGQIDPLNTLWTPFSQLARRCYVTRPTGSCALSGSPLLSRNTLFVDVSLLHWTVPNHLGGQSHNNNSRTSRETSLKVCFTCKYCCSVLLREPSIYMYLNNLHCYR